jgi:16S rRNA A1518/A1519 N6-dimethyltransferase RsmA/KsgA/DIM1 with predicted DNA glycosylase/AP lyase activity
MEGADLADIHEQLTKEGEALINEMNQYVKTFISDNYETVLGPSVFLMLCSNLPYPVMTPQIEDIMKDAPYSFKMNKMVKEFVSKAKENMQLIQEHQRLEQNAAVSN